MNAAGPRRTRIRIWIAEKLGELLIDGTPLVTAEHRFGNGLARDLVPCNVRTCSWSNLPLSGSFVEMLRRVIVDISGRHV